MLGQREIYALNSTSVNNYLEVQDAMLKYFAAGKGKSGYSKSPKDRKGGSEYDNFRYSLTILETMLCFLKLGCYYTKSQMLDLIPVLLGVLQSHHSTLPNDIVSDTDSDSNDPNEANEANEGMISDIPLVIPDEASIGFSLTSKTLKASRHAQRATSVSDGGETKGDIAAQIRSFSKDRNTEDINMNSVSDGQEETPTNMFAWIQNKLSNLVGSKVDDDLDEIENEYEMVDNDFVKTIPSSQRSYVDDLGLKIRKDSNNQAHVIDVSQSSPTRKDSEPFPMTQRIIVQHETPNSADANTTKEFYRLCLRHDKVKPGNAELCHVYENQR